MSRDTPAAPRRFRPLIVLLFGALALVLIWLVGSHWLLNSQWLPQRLSTIEGVEVRWTNAQSLHPGRWEVDNLYLAREDEALPITVEASQATLSLSLLALLRSSGWDEGDGANCGADPAVWVSGALVDSDEVEAAGTPGAVRGSGLGLRPDHDALRMVGLLL